MFEAAQKLKKIKFDTAAIFLAGALIAIAYHNTLNNNFTWDDWDVIVANESIRSLPKVGSFFSPSYWEQSLSPQGPRYMPLRFLTFAVDYQIWGLNPKGFLLTNLILHFLSVILVYLLMYALFSSKRAALFAAILFAVYPVHTESINIVKNRSDILTFIFYSCSIILFWKNKEKPLFTPANIAGYFCFIIALMSKEMAVTLPVSLTAASFFLDTGGDKKYLLKKTIPYWVILVVYAAFRFMFFQREGNNADDAMLLGSASVLGSAIITIVKYLVISFYPIDLRTERFFDFPRSVFDPRVGLSFFMLAITILIVYKLFKKSKPAGFLSVFLFILLLPVSNFVLIVSRPIAEQRLYMPSMAVCMLAALALNKLFERGKYRVMVAVILFSLTAVFARTIYARNSDYRNKIIFWEKAAEKSPNNSRVFYNLGNAYSEQNKISKAVESFWKAVELSPDYCEAYGNLGFMYMKSGSYEKAETMLKRSIELKPKNRYNRNNLAMLYLNTGKTADALTILEALSTEFPDDYTYRNNLGLAYDALALYGKALAEYQQAVRLNSRYAEAYNNMGVTYGKLKDYKQAYECLIRSIELNEYYSEAYNNLGIISEMEKKYDTAAMYYKRSILIDPNYQNALKNFARLSGKINE